MPLVPYFDKCASILTIRYVSAFTIKYDASFFFFFFNVKYLYFSSKFLFKFHVLFVINVITKNES